MSQFPGRVEHHPILGPAPPAQEVAFQFNGQPIRGLAGEPIAAALLAAGIRTLRRNEAGGDPRGLFCGIGHCSECRVVVNGEPGLRACLTPVQKNMRVESGPAAPAAQEGTP